MTNQQNLLKNKLINMIYAKYIYLVIILAYLFTSCVSKNDNGKIIFNYSLPIIIDGEVIKDTDVVLKYNNLLSSDSLVLRFMSEFSHEKITVSIDDFFYKKYDNITTNLSIGYATSVIIPNEYFKHANLIIHIRRYNYYIPFKSGYHFIDLYFDEKGQLSVNYNNTFLVLS